ncbi:MAG TPA: aldehyde dehydrogenase family protein [Dehalococcoidia bacterium]|nr:aldehyde dehydrogenase family protein [Dehalococcoidia bacterium]
MVVETKSPDAAQARVYQQFIGGEPVAGADGQTYERRNPADGTPVETIPWGGAEDARRAIAAARAAFDSGAWSKAPATVRATVLRNTAARIRAELLPLAQLLSKEVGKPVNMAIAEVAMAADVYDYYAGLALDMKGDAITNFVPDAVGLTVHEPVGVVGVITPWNFPVLLISWKLAPALAAGCTVVAKPSEFTAGTTFELARIISEAGAPKGVINVVTGAGAVVGAELAASHSVDKIAFTGSTAVGKTIMQAASGNLKKISLELGGKSPNIVFEDANIDQAVGGSFFGIYLNTGQVCQAGSRLFLHEKIKDEFIAKLKTFTATVKVGSPDDPAVTMGPVINEAQLEKVVRYVHAGQEEGAEMLCGGGRLTGETYDKGLFVQPTIFDKVTNSMTIAQEEIFGPVLSVLTFKGADEALRLANDTLYGLASAVWTRNIDTAFKMAKGLQAGTVWVNAYHSAGLPYMPYGGYKQSGIGRELGHEGLEEYMETKAIQIKLS